MGDFQARPLLCSLVISIVGLSVHSGVADHPNEKNETVRSAWLADNGKLFLRQGEPGRWVEYTENGQQAFVFEQVGKGPERIELRDKGRNLLIWLYAETSAWGTGDPPAQMVPLYSGAWTKDPPTVANGARPKGGTATDIARFTTSPPSDSDLENLRRLGESLTASEARRIQSVCRGHSLPLSWVKKIDVEAAAVLAETSNRSLVKEEKACSYVVMVPVKEQIEKKVMTEELKERPDGTIALVPVERVELVCVTKYVPEERVRKYEIERQTVPRLELDGLSEMSPKVAVGLSRHDGDLSLNSLKSLDTDSAAALSQLTGELRLNGLGQLSDPVAKELSQHEGGLLLHGVKTISRRCFDFLQGKQCFAADIVIEE